MLKLVTDPTRYPIREVDLTQAAGGLTLTPVGTPASRDIQFPRPDGGVNVIHRARRMDFELTAAVLEAAQVEDLEELVGLTDDGAPHVNAYLFPPFDASTILSFPLQGSLKGWARDPATDTLQASSLSFSRASVGYQEDRRGRWTSRAAGLPRWIPGPMGRALAVDPAWTNQVAVAHPSSGTLGWTAGVGTPTVEWVTDVRSPYADAGGCVRVRRATGSVFTVTASATISASAADRGLYSVWLRGNCRVIVSWTTASEGYQTPAYIPLSANRWTRIDVEAARTGTSTAASIAILAADDGQDRTLYIGPHLFRSHADGGSQEVPVGWVASSANKDTVSHAHPTSTPGEMTLSVQSTIPPRPSRGRWWFLGGGGTDTLTAEVVDSNFRALFGTVTLNLTPSTSEWDAAVGRPCVVTTRMGLQADGIGYRLSFDVAYTLEDGGRVRRWSSYSDAHPLADYSVLTTLTLGGFGVVEPSLLGLSWLRYDGRTWTDAELAVYERTLLEAGFRDVFRLTQGRKFLLGDPQVAPIPGTVYSRAVIPAQEVDRDDELAILS